MTDQEQVKLVRESDRTFRSPLLQDGTVASTYIRSSLEVTVELRSHNLDTSFLGKKEAKRQLDFAVYLSSDPDSENKADCIAAADPEDVPTPDTLFIRFWGLVRLKQRQLGVISSSGVEKYDGIINLELQIGNEEDSCGIVFDEKWSSLIIYTSRRKLECLHSEWISRPRATLFISFMMEGFHDPSKIEYTSSYFEEYLPFIYLEPGTRASISELSFRLSGTSDYLLTREEIRQVHEVWKKEFRTCCDQEGSDALRRTAPTIIRAVADIANQHPNLSKNIQDLNDTFSGVKELVVQLDAEIHHEKSLFKDHKYGVWWHIDSFFLYRNAKLKDFEHFLKNTSFDSTLSEYFHAYRGNLQGGYLDWLFIDFLAARKAFALMEQRQVLRQDISYNLFDSLDWKMILWRVAQFLGVLLLLLVFFYVLLPFAQNHEEIMILFIGVLSVLSISVADKLSSIATIFSQLKSNKRQLQQVENVYRLLSGPVLYAPLIMDAFRKTTEAGVKWDHRIFYLLENVIKRDEKPWSVGKP